MKSFHKLSKNPQWKGDNAKYMAFHNFARRHFGSPNFCEKCKIQDNRMYHWASKNRGRGGRNRSDWLRLCVPCHALYDGRTGRHISAEHKRKIGLSNAVSQIGNTNAMGHKLSIAKRKEISEKTKLGMKKLSIE